MTSAEISLEKVIEKAPLCLIIFDKNGYITKISGLELKNLEIHPEDFIGKTLQECPKILPISRAQLKRAFNGEEFTATFTVQHKNSFDTYYQPHFTADGSVSGVSCYSLDITKTLLVEKELETQRKQIITSQRHHAVFKVANSIAHEINNPLMIVTMNAKLLLKMSCSQTVEKEKLEKFCRNIVNGSERIAQIILQLQDFSRNNSADPIISSSVCTLVNEAVAQLENKLHSFGITLSVDIKHDLTVMCRPKEMVKAIYQIIQNAFDAVKNLPAPWIKIEASLENGAVEIAVIDSGNGIPTHLHSIIFEPFFTTQALDSGARGLGLSSAKGIINASGGTIYFDSSHANTRFVIKLLTEDAPLSP